MEKISKRKLLLAVTLFVIAIILMGSFLSISQASARGITYTAKFECSAIFEDHGLLSPGYYDTDISIFNKQGYPITVLLNVIVNNSNSSANSIIKIIQPQKSTGISCKDITKLFDIKGQDLIEGSA